ncbi:MFS transporter [bacterium]|nr:MFS transporter [bacterium]
MKIKDPVKQAIRVNYFFLAFSMGAFHPYIAPFFKETLNISNIQLGMLLLVRPAIALISQVVWGVIIDRHGHRSRWAAILSICSGCIAPLFLLGHSIMTLGVLFALWSFFQSPLFPLSDAVAFDYLGHHRRMRLAFLRIFASLGWIMAVLSVGKIYDLWDLKAIFIIFPFGVLISALALSRIPAEISVGVQKSWQVVHQLMMKQNVLYFLVAVILFETANQMCYQFLSVYGKFLGASNVQVGTIWAVATISELITMLTFLKVVQKIGIKKVLAIAMVITIFRWIPMAFVHAWWQVIPFQTLHAFTLTFGYLGAALFMNLESPDHIRFSAQAFYGMFVINTGMILGSFLGGFLSDHWGYGALYGTAGVIVACASAVLICCVHEPDK